MAITPQTDIKLLKCPIELDNKNQILFANQTAQYNYFNSLPKIEMDSCTYLRKDGIIRYADHIDNILEYNYCMYQNENYSNKWFYAFITKMEYINDHMTNIYIETDVFQTWYFDTQIKTSFVEREHVNVDIRGLHTVPEDLDTGELICSTQLQSTQSSSHAVVSLTYNPLSSYKPINKYNGIVSGLIYIVVDNEYTIGYIKQILETAGKLDALIGIYMLPDTLTGANNDYTSDYWTSIPSEPNNYHYHILTGSDSSVLMQTITIDIPDNLDGYVPKNKKLLTYPYCYIMCDNNGGNVATYKYEIFNGIPSFKIYGDITPGASIRSIPQNYSNILENNSEGLNGSKFPIGSWSGDVYTNWLTQNSVNYSLDIASGLFQIGSNLVSLNTGGIVSGMRNIAYTMADKYRHSLVPPQIGGNVNSGDVTYSTNNTKFTFYKMNIKEEFARIIDGFLSMYGYKVNITKVPNITGRQNWNYVKTIDISIEGFYPQEDLQTMKDIFNNGVTIWHNPSTFLDYSQSNNII